MNLRINLLTIILLTSVLSFSAAAQTINSEIKDLSKEADVILTGKVINQKSGWNKEKTRISTVVTLTVEEYLKGGNNSSTVTVVHPGGEVDGVGELYTHVARFEDNEEVLLFVKKDADGQNNRVLAGENGKVTLYKDKSGSEKITSFNRKLSSVKRDIKEALQQQ